MRASLNVVHAGLVAAVVLALAWSGTASAARHHAGWKGHGRPFLVDWVRSFKPAFSTVERGYYGAWASPTRWRKPLDRWPMIRLRTAPSQHRSTT